MHLRAPWRLPVTLRGSSNRSNSQVQAAGGCALLPGLAELENRLVGQPSQARREHHLRVIIFRMCQQMALLDELETCRRHFLLDHLWIDPVQRLRVAPSRA